MYWHQVAFILLFTSQLTVLINYLCALDTTLLQSTEHMVQIICYEFMYTQRVHCNDILLILAEVPYTNMPQVGINPQFDRVQNLLNMKLMLQRTKPTRLDDTNIIPRKNKLFQVCLPEQFSMKHFISLCQLLLQIQNN